MSTKWLLHDGELLAITADPANLWFGSHETEHERCIRCGHPTATHSEFLVEGSNPELWHCYYCPCTEDSQTGPTMPAAKLARALGLTEEEIARRVKIADG